MKYLIIGGTGTLGRALTEELLKDENSQVVCFSRDELKQRESEIHFKSPRLKFVLGDVRDRNSLDRVMRSGIDTVFHVAAYKHVDIAEINPEECIATNVYGTINSADCAVANGVKNFVFSSTDKAVDPINVYGFTKALSERVLLRRNATQDVTKFSVYRWGNILGSRGSVLHSFAKSLSDTRSVKVTSRDMTRFWLTIQDAAQFMIGSYKNSPESDIMIPDVKAAPLMKVIATLAKILNVHAYSTDVVGLRAGEKLHEVLRSVHTANFISSDTCENYSDAELEGLILKTLRLDGLCP